MDITKRRAVIAGNWKMNMLPSEVAPYCAELMGHLDADDDVLCVLCVPSVLLNGAEQCLDGTDICLGAQNVNENAAGAYTGEVSAKQLRALGAEYIIVGHSERRQYYKEDDPTINKKLRAVLDAGMSPILCVGETLAQREHNVTGEFISFELKAALYGVTSAELTRVIIAYEPIWAIGTGLSATAEDAQEVCAAIRAELRRHYGDAADSVSILYGGSMNENNARALLSAPDIDGGLIGGASLDPNKFAAIYNTAAGLCGA